MGLIILTMQTNLGEQGLREQTLSIRKMHDRGWGRLAEGEAGGSCKLSGSSALLGR